MLRWENGYSVSPSVKDPEKIEKKLNNREIPRSIYLLTLPSNKNNVLDLLPVSSLKNDVIYENCPLIIGMAKGKEEAMELAKDILVNCLESTGTFDLEEMINNR